jgi:hypothetical protein
VLSECFSDYFISVVTELWPDLDWVETCNRSHAGYYHLLFGGKKKCELVIRPLRFSVTVSGGVVVVRYRYYSTTVPTAGDPCEADISDHRAVLSAFLKVASSPAIS